MYRQFSDIQYRVGQTLYRYEIEDRKRTFLQSADHESSVVGEPADNLIASSSSSSASSVSGLPTSLSKYNAYQVAVSLADHGLDITESPQQLRHKIAELTKDDPAKEVRPFHILLFFSCAFCCLLVSFLEIQQLLSGVDDWFSRVNLIRPEEERNAAEVEQFLEKV